MNDVINSMFCVGAGLLVWLNVKKLYTDKLVLGYNWKVQAFFAAFGYWHLYYFFTLEQWFTLFAGCLLTAGNSTWVVMAIYYQRRNHGIKKR